MTLSVHDYARLTPIPRTDHFFAAAFNRALIEAQLLLPSLGGLGRCYLPADEYHIDQALRLRPEHSGSTLVGGTLLQPHTGTPYGRNCVVELHDEAIGWYDGIERYDGDSVILREGAWMPGYQPGRVVWAWNHGAYHAGPGYPVERYVVRLVFPGERRVRLDRAVNPALGTLKWANGVPIEDVAAGADGVTLAEAWVVTSEGLPPRFQPAIGRWVMIAGGPCVADECAGEFRRVAGFDTGRGTVRLDRPLTRSWRNAALVLGPFVQDVTVRGLTMAVPAMEPAAPCLLARGCVGLTLDGVRCLPDAAGLEPWQRVDVGFSTSAHLRLTGCTLPHGVGGGTAHDVKVLGCDTGHIVLEEDCSRILIAGGDCHAHQGQHGIVTRDGCRELVVERQRVEGFGYAGGSPIAGRCDDAVLRDVEIRGSNPTAWSFLAGDRRTLHRVKSDGTISLDDGQGYDVRDSVAKGWDLRETASGRVRDCTGTLPEHPPPGWKMERTKDDDTGREDHET